MVYEVPHMLQWGTPLDLDMYRKWSNYYRKVAEGQKEIVLPNCITALPMAGMGSRFSEVGYLLPKPCIQVNGHYMMDRALHCLPKTDKVILGALTKHKDLLPLALLLAKVFRPLLVLIFFLNPCLLFLTSLLG